jgi:hypothetical protein
LKKHQIIIQMKMIIYQQIQVRVTQKIIYNKFLNVFSFLSKPQVYNGIVCVRFQSACAVVPVVIVGDREDTSRVRLDCVKKRFVIFLTYTIIIVLYL